MNNVIHECTDAETHRHRDTKIQTLRDTEIQIEITRERTRERKEEKREK